MLLLIFNVWLFISVITFLTIFSATLIVADAYKVSGIINFKLFKHILKLSIIPVINIFICNETRKVISHPYSPNILCVQLVAEYATKH